MCITWPNILHSREAFITSPNSLSFQIVFLLIYWSLPSKRTRILSVGDRHVDFFYAVNCHANAGGHENLTMDGISGTPLRDLRSYCLSTNAAKHSSNITGPRTGLHFAQLMCWGKPWAKCLLWASKERTLASDMPTVASSPLTSNRITSNSKNEDKMIYKL